MIDITSIRIRRVKGEAGGLEAYASICLGGEFIVNDFRVVRDPSGGVHVGMPNKVVPSAANGKRLLETFHPVSPGSRARLEAVVLAAYERDVSEAPAAGR